MKAIQTRYAGCWFRSRLEARWAVFFDSLGIEWRYEPEGYTLLNGKGYLPDFYLPEKDLYLEIKGDYPTEEDLEKGFYFYGDLIVQDTLRIFILFGDIPHPYPKRGNAIHGKDTHPGAEEYLYCWQQCPVCERVDIAFHGLGFCQPCVDKAYDIVESWLAGSLDSEEDLAALPNYINLAAFLEMGGNVDNFRDAPDFERGFELLPRLFNKKYFLSGYKSRKLQQAYTAARSARFEHGQIGPTL